MNVSTTVAAQGSAAVDHNLAHFSLSFSAEGTTVPTAKLRLKKQVEEFNVTIENLVKKCNVEFVKNSFRTTSNVQKKWEYVKNRQEFKGYEVVYGMSFTIDDMDKINDVYNALTSLEKVNVSSPTFSLKNRDKLNKKALKDAVEKVQARFEMECSLLGLDPSDFEIGTWEASYSDSFRSDRLSRRIVGTTGSTGAAGPVGAAAANIVACAAGPTDMNDLEGGSTTEEDSVLELYPGMAVVTVNLEVAYVRRTNAQVPAVKAKIVAQGHSHDNASV